MKNVAIATALVLFGIASATPAHAAKRLVFEDTVIEGEVQKPEVAVYITRQNLNKAYDLNLKESFIPKIIKALDQAPF